MTVIEIITEIARAADAGEISNATAGAVFAALAAAEQAGSPR